MKVECSTCGKEAVETTLRCVKHLGTNTEAAYAEEYAVASILYYDHDISLMTDYRFDGLCSTLLSDKTYNRIKWLNKADLIAGTGFVGTNFPSEYKERAKKIAKGITNE